MAEKIWKPTGPQELLLKTALFKDKKALEAWDNWKEHVDFENIDGGSRRLLPLVYKNLQNFEVEEKILLRLKGIYKKTWFLNQLILQNSVEVIKRLQDSGIGVLVFKGMALLLVYYADSALRPMGDTDILVSWENAEKAEIILKSWGYRRKIPYRYPILNDNFMVFQNGVGFIHRSGYRVDLHWNLLKLSSYPGVDDHFWKRAKPLMLKDVRTLMLSPEDQLLQVLEHGAFWNPDSSIHWIADALFITKGNSRFDWDYFFRIAIKKYLVLPIREMLVYLKRVFGLPVPERIISAMQGHIPSETEKKLYRYMIQPKTLIAGRSLSVQIHYSYQYQHYMREFKKVEKKNNILSISRFIKFRYIRKRNWMVPFFYFLRTVNKIKRMIV